MSKCIVCERQFTVEETFELNLKMDVNSNEFYYECPDCNGEVREVSDEQQQEVRKQPKPERKARRSTRENKAFY